MAQKNQAQINELLEKGVDSIYPNREFLEKLLNSDKTLKLYLGIDPTGPDLHIGHAIPLMKLKAFQDLGHKIILLIGNFTALSGDPDKSHARARLTKKEIDGNVKTYKEQIGKILDLEGENPVEFKSNYDWHSKLKFADVVDIASNFTVQQMLERDLFEKRIEKGNPIYLHEFLYPLMQAYDSVAMDVDGELGGSDQTFNMLAGRDLMKKMANKEKFVLTTKLLEDPTGQKMGKTEGNMITLNDDPKDMFGKIMSWSDEMITLGFELCTLAPLEKIESIKKEVKSNPRNLKADLARDIISIYYSPAEATSAEAEFVKIFKDKKIPTDMEKVVVMNIEYDLPELMSSARLVSSKSEAKRLIEQGGVTLADKKITDWKKKVKPTDGAILKIGKRKFVELVMKK
jgi:tyrosyl-tRNA synthetase